MVDRIRKLIASMQMNPSQFADEIEFNRSSLSHVLSGRNKPSLDFVMKIKQRFSDVNLDWLLLGKGDIAIDTLNHSVDTGLEDIGSFIRKEEKAGTNTNKESPDIRKQAQDLEDFEVKTTSIAAQRVIIFLNNGTFEEYFKRNT